jgi:hypothetical protein
MILSQSSQSPFRVRRRLEVFKAEKGIAEHAQSQAWSNEDCAKTATAFTIHEYALLASRVVQSLDGSRLTGRLLSPGGVLLPRCEIRYKTQRTPLTSLSN